MINYQYRYGSTFLQALGHLYKTGGIRRLYSGLPFALIQAPLVRFVSTAANDGVAILLQDKHWGPAKEVAVAAVVVGLFRGMLMPIDTCKTVLQIEGGWGFEKLMEKVKRGDIGVLYSGAVANAVSSFIGEIKFKILHIVTFIFTLICILSILGHYPWFYTYNLLSRSETLISLIPFVNGRNVFIGFTSSIVSDTVANFMRVIKTTKQALAARSGDDEYGSIGVIKSNGSNRAKNRATYAESISIILAADGWRGLFGRGLKTRIFANALQSIVFTVIWRGLSERWSGEKKQNNSEDNLVTLEQQEESANESYNYNHTAGEELE